MRWYDMPDYRKLENQPLVLALVEVRFSPIFGIEKYIPDLQDKLRGAYPHVESSLSQSIEINEQGVNLSNVNRWAFASKDHSSAVDISYNRIVFFTTRYPRFEGFAEQVKQLLDILNDIAKPSLCSRIGLRYCDVIKTAQDETLGQLVSPGFLLPDCLSQSGPIAQHLTETVIETNGISHLVVRSLQAVTNNVTPPDIQQVPVKITHDDEASNRLILDFDHFWQNEDEQKDFCPNEIIQMLSQLHIDSRKAFWNVTTDYARNEKWT
jgi:uncharacterized protein (TIGR04255 family)